MAIDKRDCGIIGNGDVVRLNSNDFAISLVGIVDRKRTNSQPALPEKP